MSIQDKYLLFYNLQIKNKYYPYPVIAAGNDSYEDASFTSDADYAIDAHHVKLILCAETDNQMLNEMIEKGSVRYAHHIECQQTCFRKLVLTDEKSHEVRLVLTGNAPLVGKLVGGCKYYIKVGIFHIYIVLVVLNLF